MLLLAGKGKDLLRLKVMPMLLVRDQDRAQLVRVVSQPAAQVEQ